MKIVIKNHLREVAEIQVSYVWDREDKFLVIIDNKNKIKYCPDTYSSNFSKNSIYDLIDNYTKSILNIDINDELVLSYKGELKANRVCHNDDFMNHYKKNYQYIGCNQCSEIGLRY